MPMKTAGCSQGWVREGQLKFFRKQLLTKTSSALAGPRASAHLTDPFCPRFFLRPPGLGYNNRDTSRMLKSLRMSYAYCSHINDIQNNSNTMPVQFCNLLVLAFSFLVMGLASAYVHVSLCTTVTCPYHDGLQVIGVK